MTDTTNVTRATLIRDFSDMGIDGRHFMVHSSYRAVGPVAEGPIAVVEALIAAKHDGVLLFPTYDFHSWSERGYWDIRNSPSHMGAISEQARRVRSTYEIYGNRTSHPMLSYVVFGGESGLMSSLGGRYFGDVVNAHGIGSVFDQFVKANGVLISFSGKGFRPNDVGYTISNHAAVLANADWRFMKAFSGTYVDDKGVPSYRTYTASVGDRRYVTEVTPAHVEAERRGVIWRYPVGNTEAIVADARYFVEWAIESHKKNPELWRRERRKDE